MADRQRVPGDGALRDEERIACERDRYTVGHVKYILFPLGPGKRPGGNGRHTGDLLRLRENAREDDRLLTDYPFSGERRDHNGLLEEICTRFERYQAPECMEKELAAVTDALGDLPIDRETYGIVHYDFEPDNVLYEADSGSFGVIDFDDAIRCWYALDLVRALDAMDDVAEGPMTEACRASFMEGYRSEKDFSPEQERSLPLMRRLVRLQSYAMLLYVLSDEIPFQPDWMVQIVGKLEGVLRRTEEAVKAGS